MDRTPLRREMGNSIASDGGGQMFGVGDDDGGSVSGAAGSACIRRWYVSRGGGDGAGATSGAETTGETSRGSFSTMEGKKGVV